jgi:hypothetical protein
MRTFPMMHDKKTLLSGSVNHKFKADHNEVDEQ